MHAANKPLTEYGDLKSEHHIDRQVREEEEERRLQQEQEPPKLVVVPGPGNLVRVQWTHGNAALPHECVGDWNHKGKATEAIQGALARLSQEENSQKVLQEAEAAEAALAAQEVKAEQDRLIKESEELAAKQETPVKKTARKKSA